MAFLRPHLEYAISAWPLYLKKYINALEKVQRRATKLMHEFRNLSYEQHISKLHLTKLSTMRERGDLIEIFKITNRYNSVVCSNPNNKSRAVDNEGPAGGVRGHHYRLTKDRTTKQREMFFSNRVANTWRERPRKLVISTSINSF